MAPKRKRDDKEDSDEDYEYEIEYDGGDLEADKTFDRLYDGLDYNRSVDNHEDLDEYRRSWQLRRDLAELGTRPEGFYFQWRGLDNRIHGAPLITPPDLEAVQRVDGTWYRTLRSPNSTTPYSTDWYRDYLHTFGLPAYFLRPGHLSMVNDDAESKILGLGFNAPTPSYAMIPRRNYLRLRYDAEPMWPTQAPERCFYTIELNTRGSLAHHYPALGITQFEYRIVVQSVGCIYLVSMREHLFAPSHTVPLRPEGEVVWETFEEGSVVPSSYHRESTGIHPHAIPPQPRAALIQQAVDMHAVVNPMRTPPGWGRMAFLSLADEEEAVRRGLVDAHGRADPHRVNLERYHGRLAVGTGANAGPIVVWQPDRRLLNPVNDPTGPGAWRFLTNDGMTSNHGLAAINFGGSHGLPSYPSARQIRRLGQLFRDDGREVLTDMIDIVWDPDAEEREGEDDPVLDGTGEVDQDEATPASKRIRLSSPASELSDELSSPLAARPAAAASDSNERAEGEGGPKVPEDPTNGEPGGEHDQTGRYQPEYSTAWVRRRWVTIDRSRVKVGQYDKHKLWCYGARGWVKWGRAAQMARKADWDDPKKVSDLNKHREQTHQRAGIWANKRAEGRVDYEDEELEWVFDFVRAAGGQRPDIAISAITDEFNRRFPSHPRKQSGIMSLIDRLRKEYARFNGQMRPRKGRGWWQRNESKGLMGAGNSKETEEGEESEGGEESEDDEEDGEFEEEE